MQFLVCRRSLRRCRSRRVTHDIHGFGCGDLQLRMAGLLSRSKNKGKKKEERIQPDALGGRPQAHLRLRACRAMRVKARFPTTARSRWRNCQRISSPMRIKIGSSRFLLLDRADSRENSKTTDRKGHRGDFLGIWEVGRDLGIKTKANYKSCVSVCCN